MHMRESIPLRRAMEAVHHLHEPRSQPWLDVLEGVRQLIGADTATFIMFDGGGGLLRFEQQCVDARAERDYVEHFHAMDIVAPLGRGLPEGTWLDTAERFSQRELDRQPFYADFMRVHRMRQIVAFMAVETPQRRAGLSVQRSRPSGDIRRRLDAEPMRVFMAALQSAVRQRQRDAALSLALVDVSFGAFNEAVFLVTPGGAVLHMSELAGAWLAERGALQVRGGCLRHPDDRAQGLFMRRLRAAAGGAAVRMLLAAPLGRTHRLDIARADLQLSVSGEILLMVRVCRERREAGASPELLEIAFGITPSEARVLAALMSGLAPKQYAGTHAVSYHTVRAQIASLMEKMGCKRQADLIGKAWTRV